MSSSVSPVLPPVWTARWLAIWFLLASVSTPLPAADEDGPPASALPIVKLRGRVVCVPEELRRLHGVSLPTDHQHLWGFKLQDGTIHTLLRSRFSEAIFLDERIRQKDLLLKARVFPKTHFIEVVAINSVSRGVVQDLFYYCDVCAIKSVSPEVCSCCQGPVILTEKPLKERDE